MEEPFAPDFLRKRSGRSTMLPLAWEGFFHRHVEIRVPARGQNDLYYFCENLSDDDLSEVISRLRADTDYSYLFATNFMHQEDLVSTRGVDSWELLGFGGYNILSRNSDTVSVRIRIHPPQHLIPVVERILHPLGFKRVEVS